MVWQRCLQKCLRYTGLAMFVFHICLTKPAFQVALFNNTLTLCKKYKEIHNSGLAQENNEYEIISNPIFNRVAERAKAAGVEKVAFDRGSYQFHGRVKALADGAREGGLNF